MFWNIQFDWNGINCFIESNLYSACQHHSLAVKDARILKIDYKSQNWFIFCINTISSKVHIHIVSLPSNDYHCSAARCFSIHSSLTWKVVWRWLQQQHQQPHQLYRSHIDSRTGKKTVNSPRRHSVHYWISPVSHSESPVPNRCFIFSYLFAIAKSKKKIFSHSVLVCVCEFAKRSRSSATEEKKIRCVP